MYWIPLLLLAIVVISLEVYFNSNWIRAILVIVAGVVLTFATIGIDYFAKVADTEVWSGKIVDWSHDEEYDTYEEVCHKDSNGHQKCHTEKHHHYAENHIKTTDGGWIYVDESPDGKEFTDYWPNNKEPLKKYWKKDTPTASTHTYVNKVNASYSIYRHKEVDMKEFPDLPKYPDQVRNQFYVDRIVGWVPNKKEANEELSEINTELNKMVPDPKNKGKLKSYKEVNIIFVNVGPNKPQKYGFALQDSWEGGNKNDFVVSFSMNKDGKLNWVYPFSWSEVEILKLEVRDFMMNKGTIKDFEPVVEDVSKMVENKFERKQFADFNYLQIELSTISLVIIWILCVIAMIVNFIFIKNDN